MTLEAEMLNALKAAEAEFERIFRALPEDCAEKHYPKADVRNLIDEAIAKAEGATGKETK